MFKNLSRDIKDITNSQIKLWEVKTTMFQMKNALDDIDGRLNTAEIKVNKL